VTERSLKFTTLKFDLFIREGLRQAQSPAVFNTKNLRL
jgi:hypothetical protein